MYYLGCTYFVYNWLSIFLNKIIIFILYTLKYALMLQIGDTSKLHKKSRHSEIH